MTALTDITAVREDSRTLADQMPELGDHRSEAATRFEALGLPTRKNEAWRYTNLRPLKTEPAKDSAQDPGLPVELVPGSIRLVFVDGHYAEDRSRIGTLPDGVRISRLGNYLAANPARARDLFMGDDGVALLNSALLRDGAVISVANNTSLARPVEIVHVTTSARRTGCHLRHRIELGERAEATVIERWVGTPSAWANTVTEARVPEAATLTHLRIAGDGAAGTITSAARVSVGAEATYRATSFMIGGTSVRIDSLVNVLGEGGEAHVDGLSLAGDGQTHDAVTVVRHQVPEARSEQVYRAVGDGRAVTSFQGKVIVDKDAQKIEADQSFKAIILDRKATANAKPELEILADDVVCSHGATIGELDANALFYLTSRGISPEDARAILIEAFAGAVLTRIENDDVREQAAAAISTWMSGHVDGASHA